MTELSSNLGTDSHDEESDLRFDPIFLTAYVIVFAIGFWFIDHTPFASIHFLENLDGIGSENRTADRIESVNVVTAPVRVLLGLFGFAFLFIPARGNIGWISPLSLTMATLLLFVGASVLWSVSPLVSSQKFMVVCFFAVAAVGVARQLNISRLAFVYSAICLIYILGGAFAELLLGTFKPYQRDYRFVGTCHPNSMAVYGSFLCIVATAWFGRVKQANHWLVLLFIIGFLTLLMTKSRTTLAGFAVALVATRFVMLRGRERLLAISLTMLLVVGMCLVLTLARSNIRSAAADKVAMGRTKDVTTLTGRLPLWEELVDSIEERPLLGFGYLAFWDKDRIEYLSDVFKWEIPHGHNMYLDILLDVGFIGLVLFASVLLAGLAVSAYRCIARGQMEYGLVFGMVFFAMVHGIAESLFKLPTFLAFILATLLLRTAFERGEEQDDDPSPERGRGDVA